MSIFDELDKKIEQQQKKKPTPMQQEEVKKPSIFDELDAKLEQQPAPLTLPATLPKKRNIVKDGKGATEDSMLDDIGSGIKEAISPFYMSEDEILKDRNLKETAGYLLGNIGGAIVAGSGAAKLGATIGTAVAPGVGTAVGAAIGTIAYAIYAGVGREVVDSTREGVDFSYGRAAIKSALEGNVLLRLGKHMGKAEKVARTLGQIAGEGIVAYDITGGDKQATGIAMALGAVAPALVFRSPRTVNGGVAKNAMKAFREDNQVWEKTLKRIEDMPVVYPKNWDGVDSGFKRWVVGIAGDGMNDKKVSKAYKKIFDNHGEEAIKRQWNFYKQSQMLSEETSKARINLSKELGQDFDTSLNGVREWAMDGKFVARAVDDNVGTNLEGALEGMQWARESFNVAAHGYLDRLSKLKIAARKAGIESKDLTKALRKPELQEKLSPEGQRIAKEIKSMFDEWHGILRTAKLDIGNMENYVPLKRLPSDELSAAVNVKWEQLKKVPKDVTKRERKELQSILKKYTGSDELTQTNINNFEKAVVEVKGKKSAEISAAFERKRKSIPEFSRDDDIFRLANSYLHTNVKSTYFHDAMQSVKVQKAALEAAGLTREAKYFDRYILDMSGHSTGFIASMVSDMNARKLKWRKALDSGKTANALGIPHEKLLQVNDILAFASAQPYANFLGLNPAAALRNLWQPLTNSAPELGGAYGYKLISKSMFKTAKDFNVNDMAKFLQERGLMGKHFRGEGMDSSIAHSKLRRGIDKWNDLSMIAYSGSDTINRYTTYNAGMEWAKGLKRGDKGAIKALDNMGRGYRQELTYRMKNMNEEELGDFLGKYLVGKTQFNYGREQLNQFGRSFGKLASMFTKWPVMVASDIDELYRRHGFTAGSMKAIHRYVAPMIAFNVMASAISDDEGGVGKYLIKDPSPLQSVMDPERVMQGVGGGPLVQIPAGAASTVLRSFTNDNVSFLDAIGRASKETVQAFGPGAQFLNEGERIMRAFGGEGAGRKSRSERMESRRKRRENKRKRRQR